MGVPRLACLWPVAWQSQQAIRPIFINKASKTLARVQSSRGERRRTSSGAAWSGRLARSRDIKARRTSRGSRDVSHDDRHQAGARRAPARAASLFPLWCKGGKRRRRLLRPQTKVAISVQQDQDQEDRKMEVIVEPKTASPPEALCRRRLPFVRITCTSCPPLNLPAIVGSLPTRYLGRGPGPL